MNVLEANLNIKTSHYGHAKQFSFFNEPLIPITEGIKYTGSKLKLLPHILAIIKSLPVKSIFDGFSGTTRVSQALAKTGYSVISNDLALWSKVFAECYLKGPVKGHLLKDKIDYLNALPGRDGWFTEYYGGQSHEGLAVQSDGKKRIWQLHNTRKLDTIRPEIDKIADDSIEHSILLSSLILALDKVDNTLGHYVAYLRKWSPRSFHTLKLQVPLIERKHDGHQVMNQDIFQALSDVKADLSYFDPPYGSNNEKMPPSRVRYASYYHIWTTVCLNDKPLVTGKAHRRADCNDQRVGSVFEEFRQDSQGRFIALKALERLIKECPTRYILLSYSNGGRATKKDIADIIDRQCKRAKIFSIDYKRNVMSGMRWTYDWTQAGENQNTEFLFLIEK